MSQRSSRSPFDLISDDFFIDQILPRVDSVKSIMRLGMASKRFQSLCSHPSALQFPEFTDEVGLIKYLDSYFEAHMNKSNIIKHDFRKLLLCLQNTAHIPILDFVAVHLLGWFHKALSLNVQELILQFEVGYDRYFVRPELNLQDSIMIPLKHLRVLTLDDIPIALNDSFEHWISTYCVSLQELNLSGVLVLPTNLTIRSSSLRIFTIDSHFRNLRVSAPKLVTLHVTWTPIDLNINHGDESNLSLEISDTPNVEEFLLANWDASYDSLIYGSSGDFNFPCLQSATVLLPVKAYFSQTTDSLERLLLDISQTKELCISDTILHQMSMQGITHYATLFNMLDKFHVCIEGNKKSSWWEKAHQIIMHFVKTVPKLKTFKLTIQNGYYDPLVSAKFRESLIGNAYKLGISRPVIFLDDDKVKVVFSPEDDETLLLQHIINNAPRDLKFIFLYQR